MTPAFSSTSAEDTFNILNISNMNNILNLIVDFKTMKMCLDVEYNSDSF
jgi:hypothetical protein